MTVFWAASLGGALLLFLGTLVGASWTDQVLGERYRRLALERRELNEWSRALQEADLRCVWCSNSMALTRDPSGVAGGASAMTCGDPVGTGTAHAVGARR